MLFQEKVQDILKTQNMTQAQVAKAAGVSPSTVSNWMNLLSSPSETAKENLIKNLGLPEDYFYGHEEDPCDGDTAEADGIDVMTPAEAAQLMHKNPNTIMIGLQQGVFPWGYAVRTSEHRWSYFINKRKFYEIERIPFVPVSKIYTDIETAQLLKESRVKEGVYAGKESFAVRLNMQDDMHSTEERG